MMKYTQQRNNIPRTGAVDDLGWQTTGEYTVLHHFKSSPGMQSAVSGCGVVVDRGRLYRMDTYTRCVFCETRDLIRNQKGGEKS